MFESNEVRRVVVVVLDGLRPDAIEAFNLLNVRQLMQLGAFSTTAQTVQPSLTWPALTSLLTGAHPSTHGIMSDTLHIPRPKNPLTPMPELLARAGMPCSAFLGDVPAVYRVFGTRIGERLGFHQVRFSGKHAHEVVLGARKQLMTQRRGLIFLHLADADRVGHAHGWMTPSYREAACRVDAALGMLAAMTDVESDSGTVVIALADHGGGGLEQNNHDGFHPLNSTIPLIVSGGGVAQRDLGAVSLLDVPPTVLWLLGVEPPASYCGRTLTELREALVESAV